MNTIIYGINCAFSFSLVCAAFKYSRVFEKVFLNTYTVVYFAMLISIIFSSKKIDARLSNFLGLAL